MDMTMGRYMVHVARMRAGVVGAAGMHRRWCCGCGCHWPVLFPRLCRLVGLSHHGRRALHCNSVCCFVWRPCCSEDDPFWCPWDPKTQTQRSRTITFDFTCNYNMPVGACACPASRTPSTWSPSTAAVCTLVLVYIEDPESAARDCLVAGVCVCSHCCVGGSFDCLCRLLPRLREPQLWPRQLRWVLRQRRPDGLLPQWLLLQC